MKYAICWGMSIQSTSEWVGESRETGAEAGMETGTGTGAGTIVADGRWPPTLSSPNQLRFCYLCLELLYECL